MASDQPATAQARFGARVRKQRHKRGWTLEQLGEQAGLHWTYVGQVERGTRNISLLNILRVAAALRIDPADLLRGLKP